MHERSDIVSREARDQPSEAGRARTDDDQIMSPGL